MRTQHSVFVRVVALVVAMSASAALADGFRNPPPSVTALGHSGGNIALTEDASSLAINPANMTFATGPEAQVGVVNSIVRAKFRSAAGAGEEKTNDPLAALPYAYALTPFEIAGKSVVLGFGLNVPYGRSSEWDKDVAFSFSSPYSARLRTLDLKPTIATKLSESVSVGAGLDIYYSDIRLKQIVPWGAFTGLPTTLPGISTSDADGWGTGANAAITWDIEKGQRLSFVYRSAFDIDYSGDFNVSNLPTDGSLPPPLAAALSSESSFDTTIKYPNVFALGYGGELSDTVKIGADFEYITASRFKNLPVDLGSNNILLTSPSIEKDWDDNWTLGASVDWAFAENWTGSLGYVYIDSPIPNRTFSPLEADSDEHLISTGVSYQEGKNHFHLMYALGLLKDRTINDNIVDSVNGRYEFSVQFVGLMYQRDL